MRVQSISTLAKKGKESFLTLSRLSNDQRNQVLIQISQSVQTRKGEIQKANERDQKEAQHLVEKGELSSSLFQRLILTSPKIDQLQAYLENVASLSDPIGETLTATRLAKDLELYKVSCPIGLLAVIFESRPEVVIQVSALAIKSGNAVILKGGREATYSNRILFEIIDGVLQEHGIENAVTLIETREDVAALLQEDRSIDLIIPRGSNAFVRYIQENTKIPVMGHDEGICHLYLDQELDSKMAVEIAVDSKVDYPAACNAVETLLIHQAIAHELIPSLFSSLQEKNIVLRCCEKSYALAQEKGLVVEKATEEDWKTEYSDLILAVKLVDSLKEAVGHINEFGSHHTDSIVTQNQESAQYFMDFIDSACTFHNASTRFSDGFVFGLGAEVGISTNKTHARGPVGLEGLVIYKYLLKGSGQVKAQFSGENATPFLHQAIEVR